MRSLRSPQGTCAVEGTACERKAVLVAFKLRSAAHGVHQRAGVAQAAAHGDTTAVGGVVGLDVGALGLQEAVLEGCGDCAGGQRRAVGQRPGQRSAGEPRNSQVDPTIWQCLSAGGSSDLWHGSPYCLCRAHREWWPQGLGEEGGSVVVCRLNEMSNNFRAQNNGPLKLVPAQFECPTEASDMAGPAVGEWRGYSALNTGDLGRQGSHTTGPNTNTHRNPCNKRNKHTWQAMAPLPPAAWHWCVERW